ncbi:hypothetical protein GCM10009665_02390 [Kitasatospora nipponensis]|uniref:Uncharacterized protein n=1 Tax=Kitasatospora nipponensis TaxID=258049 RepID=A0ABP4G7U0_9ACTN
MYWYLTVRSDDHYGASVPTAEVTALLDAEPGLLRTDLACYRQAEGHPWLQIVLAACDAGGNYAVQPGRAPQRVGVVELICSAADGSPGYDPALALARRLAAAFGWEVLDPDTDELLHPAAPATAVPAAPTAPPVSRTAAPRPAPAAAGTPSGSAAPAGTP